MGAFQMRIITGALIVATGLGLSACASTPGQLANEYRDACISQGATVESGQLYDCMRSLEQASIADNQRRTAQGWAFLGALSAVGGAAAREGYERPAVQCTSIPNGPYVYTNCH